MGAHFPFGLELVAAQSAVDDVGVLFHVLDKFAQLGELLTAAAVVVGTSQVLPHVLHQVVLVGEHKPAGHALKRRGREWLRG